MDGPVLELPLPIYYTTQTRHNNPVGATSSTYHFVTSPDLPVQKNRGAAGVNAPKDGKMR